MKMAIKINGQWHEVWGLLSHTIDHIVFPNEPNDLAFGQTGFFRRDGSAVRVEEANNTTPVGIRCYEAWPAVCLKQKPRVYLGVLIHRNTEPHKLRWWALTPSGQVASDSLAGIKSLIKIRNE